MSNKFNADKLIDNYASWLRKQHNIEKSDTYTEVNTPFLNNLNDNIRFFIEYKDDGTMTLDDNGDTINNLEMLGIDISEGQRNHEFHSILNQFNVKHPDDRILVKGRITDFPILEQRLISAIIRIDDLKSLKRSTVSSIFYDDMYNFFHENNLNGIKNYSLAGKSGNDNRFSYVIPKERNSQNISTLIDLKNNLSFNDMAAASYKFEDVKKASNGNQKAFIIYNDAETKPSTAAENIAISSNIYMLKSSNKEDILQMVS